jgi:hypothetical protein
MLASIRVVLRLRKNTNIIWAFVQQWAIVEIVQIVTEQHIIKKRLFNWEYLLAKCNLNKKTSTVTEIVGLLVGWKKKTWVKKSDKSNFRRFCFLRLPIEKICASSKHFRWN